MILNTQNVFVQQSKYGVFCSSKLYQSATFYLGLFHLEGYGMGEEFFFKKEEK